MLEILKYPDPRLKQVSAPVQNFDKDLHVLLGQMQATLYAANGIGLAAPQVGVFQRAFIVDIDWINDDGPGKRPREYINPVLSDRSGRAVYEEGCLSVPGVNEEVKRAGRLKIRYQDRFGKSHEELVHDLLAVAIQHENDHLDGILFIDHS